jgi:hypothetical protein
MIFSALALVAFSFTGMANETKEEKVENFDACMDAAFAFLDAVDPNGNLSDTQAATIVNRKYAECVTLRDKLKSISAN